MSAPFFDETFIDFDSNEDPDDERPTFIAAANIGGGVVDEGEEAVWMGTLPPGDYIIIVGGGDGATGPYDLSVRVVPPTWLE